MNVKQDTFQCITRDVKGHFTIRNITSSGKNNNPKCVYPK